tara:strand:- start:370 stop:1017 length:648 start_codon:yes stop_codon:yes gene_type:complete
MKKYIGMAWPSDGLNDSEYWRYLPNNYELLISRYRVSGSLKPEIIKKEGNINTISKSIESLNYKKLDIIILCDFACSVMNLNYHKISELYFTNKFKIPCINILSATLNFINKRRKKLSIISPYNKQITEKFSSLVQNNSSIASIDYLSLNSEVEIDKIDTKIKTLKLHLLDNDILFLGGGISISHFYKKFKKNYGINIYSSPLILIKNTINILDG